MDQARPPNHPEITPAQRAALLACVYSVILNDDGEQNDNERALKFLRPKGAPATGTSQS
jgi:hypothetical protein